MYSAASLAPASLSVPMKRDALVDALGVDEHAPDALRLGRVDDGRQRDGIGRRERDAGDALGELVLDLGDLRLDVEFGRRGEHDDDRRRAPCPSPWRPLDGRPERIADAADARRLRVAADGVDVAADRRLVQEERHADEADEKHDGADREFAEQPQERDRDLRRAEEFDRLLPRSAGRRRSDW